MVAGVALLLAAAQLAVGVAAAVYVIPDGADCTPCERLLGSA
jgi:hypothetical protein